MKGIKWIQFGTKKFPHYCAKIGYFELVCRRSLYKWRCSIYFGDKWISDTHTRKSLELVQKDAERLAIQYLFGHCFTAIEALKKVDLLEEVLSEVGVDL